MAIQFFCTNCNQPIEVDNEFAGRSAACPYCRTVISVPAASTLQPGAARPPAAPPPPDAFNAGAPTPPAPYVGPAAPPPPTPGGYPPPPVGYPNQPFPSGQYGYGPVPNPADEAKLRSARTWGNYALISAAISVVMTVACFGMLFSMMVKVGAVNPNATSQPSPEDMERLQKEMQKEMGNNGLYSATVSGLAFFSLVGAALAIYSLIVSTRSNWRAIVALVLCAPCVPCSCMALISALAARSMPG